MGTAEVTVRLVAGVALILANGFFVAIEFALTRARQYPAEEFDEPGLRRAWEMTDDLEIYLTSCQVGITASSIAVGIVAEPALAALFEPWFTGSRLAGIGAGATIAFLIINLVHLTHGEQTPTYLGVERAKFVCRYGATPLYYFAVLISPIIRIGDGVAKWTLGLFGIEMTGAWLETETDRIESRADLRSEVGSALAEGDLSEERREEVLAALNIDRITAGDAMVDREDVVAVRTDDDVETNVDRMAGSPHVRFPIVGDTVDDYRGVVYMPPVLDALDDLRAGERTFEDLAEPPLTVAAGTPVSEIIDRFQAVGQELALVTEDDRVVGLLTATDALEQIAGEMEDPMDRQADRDR
jgi:IMP dehydrogenase